MSIRKVCQHRKSTSSFKQSICNNPGAGKRPDYAPMESSEEEDEEFQFIKKAKEQEVEPEEQEEEVANDPRLRRLQNRITEDVEER